MRYSQAKAARRFRRQSACLVRPARSLIRTLMLVAAVMAGMLAGSAARAQVRVPTGTPAFLAFPSTDTAVHFNQAWFYEANGLKNDYCAYPKGDVRGYGRHC